MNKTYFENIYIQVEGADGCGKSTFIKKSKDFFVEKGICFDTLFYPSYSTKYGHQIHEILNRDVEKYGCLGFDPYLGIALNSILDQHIYYPPKFNETCVEGKLYMSSRGFLSTLVYSNTKYLDYTLCDMLLPFYKYLRKPDLIVYLNPSSEIIKKRLARRKKVNDYDSPDLTDLLKERYAHIIPLIKDQVKVIEINDDDILSNLDYHLENLWNHI